MARTRGLVAVILMLAAMLLPARPLRADEGAFTFQPPDGWKTATNDPEVRRILGPLDVAYLALAPGDLGRMAAIYLSEDDSAPIDAAYVDRVASRYLSSKSVHIAGVITRREVVDVDGLPWGRIEGATPEGAGLLAWLVPGRPRSALILFYVPANALDRLRPSLDASARATRGATAPAERRDQLKALVGAAALMAVTLSFLLLRRRRARS
jgi:hypothetical protein